MKNYCIDSWINKVALQTLLAWLALGCTSAFAIAATGSLDLDWKAPLAQEHPLVGKIYQSNAETSLQSLVDLMADNRYVLIGEKHDNIDHHQLELYLLKLLIERNAAAIQYHLWMLLWK